VDAGFVENHYFPKSAANWASGGGGRKTRGASLGKLHALALRRGIPSSVVALSRFWQGRVRFEAPSRLVATSPVPEGRAVRTI